MDIKTLYATKARTCIAGAGRAGLPTHLLPDLPHTHNALDDALDDALEQAEIFARVFEWEGARL